MTVEQFYEEQNYPKYDKFDKKAEKFTYYDLTEFAENYRQSKVKKFGISGVINWAYFNDEKPSYGDQILIQDPPEQMSTPRVEIYDRDTTWIDGSRYAVITPCL